MGSEHQSWQPTSGSEVQDGAGQGFEQEDLEKAEGMSYLEIGSRTPDQRPVSRLGQHVRKSGFIAGWSHSRE